MKIKRFKNLWFMGLIMSAVILGAIYLLKIFMPQFVINVAHIDSIVNIGHYIDTHKWAWYLASTILSTITYYFYCGACCEKKKFNYLDWIYILASILIGYIVKEFLPIYYTALNYVCLIVVPFLMKGKFLNTTISFSTVLLLQALTMQIRNIGTMIIDINFATMLILMVDVYIYQVLLYLFFNYRKEN